jgi:predicted O-methyltransferase YrrM
VSDLGIIASVPRKGPRARIFIATPTYDGTLHHRYVSSLMAATLYCLFHKVELELRIIAGASLIQYARNQLVREFLEDPTYTHMMWIDSDVGFDPRAIMQLLDHHKEVVGGVYPMKCTPIEWPYAPAEGQKLAELHKAAVMPGGFLLCTRKAMQTVADASGEYWHHMGGLRHLTKHVFDLVLENRQLLGEDIILCRKLIACGIDVWCDPDLPFVHCGGNEWRGNLADAVRQGAVTQPIDRSLLTTIRTETDHVKLGAALHSLAHRWGNSWSAPSAELLALTVLARKATRILEAGSGISTIVMASANPDAQVHALESDLTWVNRMREECEALKLTNVTIHHAPLGSDCCYEIPKDLPASFDLAFIDGPVWLSNMEHPTDTRRPLYTKLADRLANAVIVIDDIEHYEDIAARYRHEIVGNRFAVCLPANRKAEAA